ncbi:hypothetical protein [Alcanivorax sp.]|uniref:hypothetical protein n=1 Tax=Alcanivorax sp. TaxID=1872427 RepID=UPI000C5DC831|nr:hypothetical protein [Alcanivorax sp.]MBU86146.1 hypothetical protein [Alcanivorax sp.]|tara:strand:- start:147 stop:1016 length:870 start_codon:yes stop_codon:yes gene_type:complete
MQSNGVKPIMHSFALVVALCLLLSACQSSPGQGEFYVYTDAQGNLVTIEKPVSEQAAKEAKEDSVETVDTSGADLLSAPLEDYRPSEEIDQELAAKERDRFITYVDESGQLVSRPVDMVAEKEAKKRVEPDYAELPGGDGFLETYRTIRQDCCLHLLDETETLGAGQETLITFGPDSPVLLGDQPFKAKALKLAENVNSLDLKAFIRKKDYVAAQLLWLDEQGRPLLLVDQPFSRKYPETWYRYGYLQGTFPRESGQRHLVVFLPYQKEQPSTDGLQAVLNGELLLSAQ